MTRVNEAPGSTTNFASRQLSDQRMYPDINDASVRCRICLQHNGELVQLPCSCVGEMGLVHQSCFSQWVKTIKDQHSPLRRQGQNLTQINQSQYQMPCEICKTKIKLRMQQKRGCVKCKDIKKPELFISILCILFNIGIIGVVSFLCINGVINSDGSGVRIFINLFILLIVYLTLGWLIRRQTKRLIRTQISDLKIISSNRIVVNQENQVANFVSQEEMKQNQHPKGQQQNKVAYLRQTSL